MPNKDGISICCNHQPNIKKGKFLSPQTIKFELLQLANIIKVASEDSVAIEHLMN